jgi:3'-phosphoadenosine 5'-phosphosulfate sulfotransferase (PAPS reductase)/FAD synthetase
MVSRTDIVGFGDYMKGKTIVVWFSCGAASAVAAKKTIELYGADNTIRVVNNPIKEEHEDNQRFLKDVEKWLGVTIEFAVNPKFPNASCVEVWDKGYMSGISGASCTRELKKKARQEWERNNHFDHLVLGFTADEEKRAKNFMLTESDKLLPVLIDLNLTKQDCFNIIKGAGIPLPAIYSYGYPNANCIGCVKATSPSYWQLVKNTFPDVFKQRAEQSRKIGCRLVRVKGKRMFLDEMPEIKKIKNLSKLDFECGIFCEEPLKKTKADHDKILNEWV